jgi:uncharacterized protein (TIGR02217 family)
MGVLGQRFPDIIARGAIGAHGHFSTTIVEHQGGHETVNLDWPIAKGRWNVARAIERENKHALARRHFLKARGRFHRFLFKDWTDFAATRTGDDRGRVIAGPTGGTLQVCKVYGADEPDFEYVRPIYRLRTGLQVWVSGALQGSVTVDNDTGLITAAWDPEDVELAFQFDVLCRYEVDGADPRLVHRRPTGEVLLDWQNIDIVEIREETEA